MEFINLKLTLSSLLMSSEDLHVLIIGAGILFSISFPDSETTLITGITGLLIAQGLKKVYNPSFDSELLA